jgi:hypothetical protein
VDDVRTAIPPSAVDSRIVTPPPAADARAMGPPPSADAGAQGSVGDVGASTSSPIIDVNPINEMPGGVDEDLVRDQAQIDHVPKDLETFGTQVPDSSS